MSGSTHLAVGAVMQVFRWQYGLIAMAVLFLVFWDPIDRWLNFETRQVEVTDVKELCAAFRKGSNIPLAIGACPSIRINHAGRADIDIKPRTFVSFDYISPADRKAHSISIVRAHDDAGNPVTVGSRIQVRLSTRDPLVVRLD